MMPIKIEKATAADVAEIAKIEKACFAGPWSEQSIRESLDNPASRFYLAYLDGKAAGYMGLQIFSGEGYVTNVATLPEFRRRGAARALMLKAMENEMEFITLEVRESNLPAIRLYESLGFQKVGLRPHFYRAPDENALLMTKYFNTKE